MLWPLCACVFLYFIHDYTGHNAHIILYSTTSWRTIYSMMLKCCGCVYMMGKINTMVKLLCICRMKHGSFFLSFRFIFHLLAKKIVTLQEKIGRAAVLYSHKNWATNGQITLATGAVVIYHPKFILAFLCIFFSALCRQHTLFSSIYELCILYNNIYNI